MESINLRSYSQPLVVLVLEATFIVAPSVVVDITNEVYFTVMSIVKSCLGQTLPIFVWITVIQINYNYNFVCKIYLKTNCLVFQLFTICCLTFGNLQNNVFINSRLVLNFSCKYRNTKAMKAIFFKVYEFIFPLFLAELNMKCLRLFVSVLIKFEKVKVSCLNRNL